MTAVLICAAGEGTRWHGGQPKQLAWLGDETILQRQIRQVKARGVEPLIVTRDEQIELATWDNDALTHSPASYRWLAETILDTHYRWQDHTIALLGDVIYSRALMDALFTFPQSIAIYGNNAECLALTFTEAGQADLIKALQMVIQATERGHGYGKLWNLCRLLDNLPIEQHFIREDGVFVRVHDWSTDVDTPEAYLQLQRNVLELEIIDDRLPVGEGK